MIKPLIKLWSIVANSTGFIMSSGKISKLVGIQFITIVFMILGSCSNQLAEDELDAVPYLSKLILVDAVTQKDIGELVDNYSFNASPVNIRVEGTAASVVFQLTDAESDVQIDNAMPYTLKGDIAGVYNAWRPRVGKYTLKATPYSQKNGKGVPGNSITVNFISATPPVIVPLPVAPPSNTLLFNGIMNSASLSKMTDWWSIQPWLTDIKAAGFSSIGTVGPNAYTTVEKVMDNGVSVLKARIIGNDPNDAGRFQTSTYFTKEMGIYHHTQRMKIHSDVAHIANYNRSVNGGRDWFAIFETWMGNSVSRMNLSLTPVNGKVNWEIDCEWEEGSSTPYRNIWSVPMNSAVPVPFGKWFTMDVYIKSGEGANGRIKITITVDGEAPAVLFDVNNTTTVPGQPSIFRRKTDHMKWYVGQDMRKFMLDAGKALEISYGDYKIFKD